MPKALTDDVIEETLERFYGRVRTDPDLGKVFSVVEDWDEHLTRLREFWSSMMLGSGSYKGNPLSMHLAHAEKFKPALFIRWLELWRQTTDELVVPDVALKMQARAGRIASKFSTIICGEPLPEATADAPRRAATVPYRISALFDEGSLPRGLLGSHSLKSGTWAIVRIEEGSVRYCEDAVTDPRILAPGAPAIVPPGIAHHLELVGRVKLRIEFYDRDPTEIQQY